MLRVLYVDDDELMREIAEIAFARDAGVVLRLAADGAQGLKLAQAEPFDLILLDVVMPGLDGAAVFDALRAEPKTKDVPVAFVSARTESSAPAALHGPGCIGLISKPLKVAELVGKVRALLEPAA
jgi:DNA-binding response OmpR family regulator